MNTIEKNTPPIHTPSGPLRRRLNSEASRTALKKAINTIFSAVAIIIVLLIIISAFPVTGNFKILVVQSGSMEPNIHTGSVVVVKPEASYQEGDVITFKSRGGKFDSITHRIVKIGDSGTGKVFTTKGDANNANDTDTVSSDQIIGKVLFSIPYFGYAVATAKQPIGFLALIIIPAALIIIEEVLKIWKEVKVSRKNKHAPDPSQEGKQNLEK